MRLVFNVIFPPRLHTGEVAVLYTAKIDRYPYFLQGTPLPITAELQIEYREFPGPICGANPILTSLKPEDPGRGAPTRLLGKRASRGTRHKIAFHIGTNEMASKLTKISLPYRPYNSVLASVSLSTPLIRGSQIPKYSPGLPVDH